MNGHLFRKKCKTYRIKLRNERINMDANNTGIFFGGGYFAHLKYVIKALSC